MERRELATKSKNEQLFIHKMQNTLKLSRAPGTEIS